MLAEAGGAAYLREFQQRFSPSEEKFFAKEPREWKVARCDKYGREEGREEGGGGERRGRGGSICRFSVSLMRVLLFPSPPLLSRSGQSRLKSCKTVVRHASNILIKQSYNITHRMYY